MFPDDSQSMWNHFEQKIVPIIDQIVPYAEIKKIQLLSHLKPLSILKRNLMWKRDCSATLKQIPIMSQIIESKNFIWKSNLTF